LRIPTSIFSNTPLVIDAAALGPFKKQTRGHGRENYLLYFGCDFSGLYNFGKIMKIVATKS